MSGARSEPTGWEIFVIHLKLLLCWNPDRFPLSYGKSITARLDTASLNPMSLLLSQFKSPPWSSFSKVCNRREREECGGPGNLRWAEHGGRWRVREKWRMLLCLDLLCIPRCPDSQVRCSEQHSLEIYLFFIPLLPWMFPKELPKPRRQGFERGWGWGLSSLQGRISEIPGFPELISDCLWQQ